ncbi:MAG: ABC transporter permease, partial [Longimicrobiales bacterium]
LLVLYPAGFRRALGQDLVETAERRWREAKRLHPMTGGARFWWTEGLRFVVDGVFERLRTLPVVLDDLRHGWQQLRRTPGHHALAILTLALGIGATTTIFTVADAVVFRPLPYADAEALYLIHSRFGGMELSSNSLPNFRDLESSARTLSWLAAAHDASPALTDRSGEPERVSALYVTWNYLPGLGARVDAGRPFDRADYAPGAERVAIVSGTLARRRWGRATVAVGKSVRLDGVEHRVVGANAPSFRDPEPIESGAITDVWVPAREGDGAFAHRDAYWFRLIARLAPGATPDAARRELTAAGRHLAAAYPSANTVDADSLDFVLHALHESTVGDARQRLLLLLGAVALLLVLSCANVASLFLTRGVARTPELAVRSALGATRARLTAQLLAESLLTATVAGIVGGLMGFIGLRIFVAVAPPAIPRLHEVSVDVRALLFVVALTVITAIVFGTLPALRGAR